MTDPGTVNRRGAVPAFPFQRTAAPSSSGIANRAPSVENRIGPAGGAGSEIRTNFFVSVLEPDGDFPSAADYGDVLDRFVERFLAYGPLPLWLPKPQSAVHGD